MNSEKLKFKWISQDINGVIRFHYTEPINCLGKIGWFCNEYYSPEVLNPNWDSDYSDINARVKFNWIKINLEIEDYYIEDYVLHKVVNHNIHPHADLIMQQAKNKDLEFEFLNEFDNRWYYEGTNPGWNPNIKYRVKPPQKRCRVYWNIQTKLPTMAYEDVSSEEYFDHWMSEWVNY